MVVCSLRPTLPREPALFIRLYLDEDVHKQVAAALRLRSFDAISTHEVGRRGHSDAEQLVYATNAGRTLFTFNTSDYLHLHRDWLQARREHAGIVISDRLPIGEIIRRLLNLLNRVTADEIRNQIRWLQTFK
jgi:Domain of unknown function (DUF5615)